MDSTSLHGLVTSAISGTTLTLDTATLGSPAVTALAASFLGGGTLAMTGVAVTRDAGDDTIVAGRLGTAVLGLTGLTATARFGVTAGTATLHMDLTGLPAGWRPSQSLPALAGTVLDQFTWTGPVLSLDSAAPPALPADYPVGYGYPALAAGVSAALVPGLGLAATVTPATPGTLVGTLLGGRPIAVSGPVLLPAASPAVLLRPSGAPSPPVALGPLSAAFGLVLAVVPLEVQPPGPPGPAVEASTYQLQATVRADLNGTTYSLPLTAQEHTAGAPLIAITTPQLTAQPITLGQVAQLIGRSVTESLPTSGGFPALNGIALAGVEVIVVPSAAQPVLSLGATVTWQHDAPYPVFGGLITFDALAVTFTYVPSGAVLDSGTTVHVTADVAATATVAGGKLEAELSLPEISFACVLAPGTSIDLASFVRATVGDSVSMPHVTCTELAITGDVRLGEYRFRATVTDDWGFTLGSTPLALTQIGMDITKDATGFSGEIVCEVTIGGALLAGRAAFDAATGGWSFQVGTMTGAPVDLTALIADIGHMLGVSLPDHAPSLILDAVNFTFDTATHAFTFQCDSSLKVGSAAASFGVEITNQTFTGYLWVGDSYFTVDFQNTDARTILTASWTAGSDQATLEFADIAAALGLSAPQVPAGLDLRLSSASLTYNATTQQLIVTAQTSAGSKGVFVVTPAAGTQAMQFLAALAVGHPIDLSDLPVVGEVLGPQDTLGVEDLQVILSGGQVSPDTARSVNPLVPAGYPAFPVTGTASPVALSAILRFGAETIPVVLGVPAQADGASTAATTVVGAPATPPAPGTGGVVAVPPAASDGTAWFAVQKVFGPVTVERVGVRYADEAVQIFLDAFLTMAGVSLSLQGASVRSPITGFSPVYELRGLGVGYSNPPLTIAGDFAQVTPAAGATFQYDGAVIIALPQWGITAYGSYTLAGGEPSLFVFLRVSGGIGGPPAFFITGLAGGFGYNSAVRIPAPDAVADFPLVGGLSNAALLGGPGATPLAALAALSGGANPWITHAPGQNWLAVGVSFTTYRVLDSTALLLVEFGNELTAALLGISTARFPASPAQPPYAQIQLQLLALLRPRDGFLGITAMLTRNSFLIDPACVLTGGFAFYVWFDPSPQAGDFVVVLGGYHPSFVPPPYYPAVPRLGFSWSLGAAVSISGTAYFALTPAGIMAGGALDIRYHDGSLSAWFTAHADFLVTWSPFHFSVTIGVSIGVSYTMNLWFTTTTIHLEAGADLALWGPPTGGTVRVRLWVISFTVAFGALPSPNQVPLNWQQFQELLPPGSATTITCTGGLTAQQTANAAQAAAPSTTTGTAAPAPWLVLGEGFSCTVRSAVPSTRLFLGSKATTPFATGSPVSIRPMGKTGLTVDQRLTVTVGGTEIDLAAAGWQVTAATASLAKALWGTGDGSTLAQGIDQLVTGQLTGFAVQAPPAAPGWSAGPIPAATLGTDPLAPPGMPLSPAAAPAGDVAAAGTGAVALIAAQIAAAGADARATVVTDLTALGLAPAANDPLTAFAAQAGTLFAAEPLLVTA